MQALTASSKLDFLSRFSDFEDSVLRSANVSLWPDDKRCELLIQAPDRESPSGWSNLTLRVLGVKCVHLDRSRYGVEVLGFGLQVFFRADAVYLFLDASYEREVMPELSSNAAFVTGEGVEWEATSYRPPNPPQTR